MVEIVGRDEELAAVLDFVERPADGLAALVLGGEAGIGKSTLWLAGVEAARERGLRILVARPAEAEQALALTGLADLLDGVVDEVLAALTAPQRRALEVALLIEDASGEPADPRALGVAVRSALRRLAEAEPLVVAIDDVQWLDRSSAGALGFALRRLEDANVRLLLARRGEGASVEAALDDSRTTRVPVGPFSVGALHALLRARLGRTFARPTLVRLHEASGGNPFYALELARDVDGAARIVHVPETLAALVRGRLAPLPAQTRAALLTLAAFGRSTLAALQAAGVDERALEPARAADVVEIVVDEVRFTHPLLSSTLYGDAAAAERREIHSRIAQAVTEPVMRARHLALAHDEPDESIAQELEHAADLARARGATAVAAELAELAGKRTPAEAVDRARRRLVHAAGDYVNSGAPELAVALGQQLLAEAAPGQARAEALALLGDIQIRLGKPRPAVAYLREALGAQPDAADLELGIHWRLAWQLLHTEGVAAAESHALAAVALAARVNDSRAVPARLSLAANRFLAGKPEGLELADQALRLARSSGDAASIARATGMHGQLLLALGRLAEAREILSECHRWAVHHDEPTASAMLAYLALLEHRAGDWELARSYAERAGTLEAHYVPEEENVFALALRARIAAHDGDEAAAGTLVERALAASDGEGAQWQATFEARSLAGMLAQWRGDPRGAVEQFGRVERERRATGYGGVAAFPHRGEYLEALLQLGRPDDAGAALRRWEADAVGQESAWELAGVAHSWGVAAAAAGRLEEAVARLEDAAEQQEAVGDPFGRARTLLALGIARRRRRQKRAAREALEAALDRFEKLGAAGWAERARAELGRIGGRLRGDGLSPAEQRVAALVAEGKTNREVAAALFLGERTVETHLTSVYAKLGIRSRTELARALPS